MHEWYYLKLWVCVWGFLANSIERAVAEASETPPPSLVTMLEEGAG
eukprot:COSAG01_NODE_24885_length_763_cov_0.573795_1_plen_45_part_10